MFHKTPTTTDRVAAANCIRCQWCSIFCEPPYSPGANDPSPGAVSSTVHCQLAENTAGIARSGPVDDKTLSPASTRRSSGAIYTEPDSETKRASYDPCIYCINICRDLPERRDRHGRAYGRAGSTVAIGVDFFRGEIRASELPAHRATFVKLWEALRAICR